MSSLRYSKRLRKKYSIRKKIRGTSECPRLTVTKTCKHIYAQIIDDVEGITLCAASSLDKSIRIDTKKHFCNVYYAKEIAKILVMRAKKKNITKIVFDRNGYIYHGRVKVISDTCRELGLIF